MSLARGMTEDQAEITARAQRVYAAYNRRDWDALFAETGPDWEWDVVEEIMPFRGYPEVGSGNDFSCASSAGARKPRL